jgi:hypothetical protein
VTVVLSHDQPMYPDNPVCTVCGTRDRRWASIGAVIVPVPIEPLGAAVPVWSAWTAWLSR